MLAIHHLGHSQSSQIIWLCKELGLPYGLKLYERDPVTIGLHGGVRPSITYARAGPAGQLAGQREQPVRWPSPSLRQP